MVLVAKGFSEYKSQKHNSDKFDSFQFLQFILTSK